MKMLWQTFRRYLVIFSSLIFTVACLGLHVLHSGKSDFLQSEYDRLVKKRSSMLLNLKNGATFEEDISSLEKILENVDGRLFDPKELAGNYNYFFQIESQTGVKLRNLQQFNISPVNANRTQNQGGEFYSSLRYEMGVSGTYAQILNFLRAVEGGESLYKLNRMSITQGKVIDESTDALDTKISFSVLSTKQS